MHGMLPRCALLLACSVGACGRIGVELLPGDLEASVPDDPWAALDGGEGALDGGGTLSPNTPVAEDAGASTDAAVAGDGGALTDAAVAPDAAVLDAGSACAGTSVFALCWYLGAADQSCTQTCASRGGFDTRAASFVGSLSQGGSRADCASVMRALGQSGTVREGMRGDGNGFGCHLWPGGDLWWLELPNLDPAVASSPGTGVRIACGCLR